MPGDGESPEDESAKDGLAKDERKNVALAGEEPAHGRAAKQCQRNEDGVGPMKGREKQASNDGCDIGAGECAEQAVHGHGLQRDLLQRAKSEISDEAMRLDEVSGQAMQSSEGDAYTNQSNDEDKKDRSGELRGGLQIIRAPSERFGIVAMQEKAEQEPNRED